MAHERGSLTTSLGGEDTAFTAALAQLRFAVPAGFGNPFAKRSLDRLIDSIVDTKREFGAIGEEGATLFGRPILDDEARRGLHLRCSRT